MAATSPPAFVGRETELARLVAALEDAGADRAPAIVIEGESGAGKSRLLTEFAVVAGARGATVLSGRGVDCGDAGPPFWPFTEALRRLTQGKQATDGGGRPSVARAADAGSAEEGTGAVRDGRAGAAQPPPAGGMDDRVGYFEEVLDRLVAASRRGPVVLLIDDLHWADRATRDLLGFLLANLADGPAPLVVVTVRSEALGPGHPLVPLLAELRRSRRAEFLSLERLGKTEVAAQLTSILGERPEPELLEEIWRRSEGNPFFVEELLAAARSGRELTSTLQPILAARLAALSPDARAAAGAAAASVGPVAHRLLADVAGLTEPALLAGLRECVDTHILVVDSRAGTYAFRHGLLQEAAYAALLPGEAIRLHAAYGRALSGAVDSIAPITTPAGPPAAPTHTGGGPGVAPTPADPVAADPVAAMRPTGGAGPGVADLAAVAWHLYAAGNAAEGLPAALAAGVAAEAAGGYAGAHLQYERALELAGRQPAEALEPAFLSAAMARSATPVGRFDRVALAERAAEAALLAGVPGRAGELLEAALVSGPADDAARLQLALGRARWAAGDSEGALAAYDEAIRRLPDPETAEGVRTVAAAAEARMLTGRYGESLKLAENGLALARRLGLPLEEAEILGTLGVDLALLGDAEPAIAALDEAVMVARQAVGRAATSAREGSATRRVDGRGPRPLARALLNRAEVLSGPLNRLDEAAGVAAAGLEELRRRGLERSYAGALAAIVGNTLFRAGRWDEADPVIDAALAERPTGAAAIELLLARARLAVGRGRFEAAHADLERVDLRWTQAVAPRYRAPLLTLEAGLALWESRADDAREAVARALELVEGSDDLWLVAPVLWHGLRAEADRADHARALGDRATAKAAAEAAATLLDRARAVQDDAAPAVRPVVAAYEALCLGEARRAGARDATTGVAAPDQDDAEVWAGAAERWTELGQPYPAAYARFREAEAVLGRQARSARAAAALRSAHEIAVRLGAEPFRREIEALGARARLTLASAAPRQSGAPQPEAATTAPLDALTVRELDVLGLMVEGRTNREIAAALFISEKTASVHVSHILAKLGVRSRVQAVAVAHRGGMARAGG